VDRHLVEEPLRRITRALNAGAPLTPDRPGLLDGRAGVALFFLYYAHFTGDPADRLHAEAFVEDLFTSLPDEMPFSFCSGLAGVAWLLRHAARSGLVDVNADQALQDIDEQLRSQMVLEMRAGRFDFLHGALGCALYNLETAAQPSSRQALVQTLDELERHGVSSGTGLWWRNPQIATGDVPPDAISLGLSHGMPSIFVMLSRFAANHIDEDRARALAGRAIRFVLDSESTACFPAMRWLRAADQPSRLAWCYGDPGVAIALWQAGAAMDRSDWCEKALAVLERSATRRAPDDTLVQDAGCCHGSAGLALIFARMHQRTGRDTFKHAARFWIDETLSKGRREDGFGGYRAYRPDLPDDLASELSLLMGIAGIGLTLMALASPIEPAWDRALLLS
jgi:lantibiotic modifying enzyme